MGLIKKNMKSIIRTFTPQNTLTSSKKKAGRPAKSSRIEIPKGQGRSRKSTPAATDEIDMMDDEITTDSDNNDESIITSVNDVMSGDSSRLNPSYHDEVTPSLNKKKATKSRIREAKSEISITPSPPIPRKGKKKDTTDESDIDEIDIVEVKKIPGLSKEKATTTKPSKPRNKSEMHSMYVTYDILSVIAIKDNSQEIPFTDDKMKFTMRATNFIITSEEDPTLKIHVPCGDVKTFKSPKNTGNSVSTSALFIFRNDLSITIKGRDYRVDKLVCQFKYIIEGNQLKTMKGFLYECQFINFTSIELAKFFTKSSFKPSSVDNFYGSGGLKPFASTKLASSMAADFSSLSRTEKKVSNLPIVPAASESRRSHRRGTVIRYKNEDSEEEKANEKMVSENGEIRPSEYTPDDDQLVLEPKLKYKFDNKKTFTITNNDFKCLYNDNWINDTLVDFFLNYHLKNAKEKKIARTNSIEILNSFFFTSLARPREDLQYYQNVKSWFKMNDTLFDKDFVIIPIMQDLHWYFVVITDLKALKRKHNKLKNPEEGDQPADTVNKDKPDAKSEELSDESKTAEDSQPLASADDSVSEAPLQAPIEDADSDKTTSDHDDEPHISIIKQPNKKEESKFANNAKLIESQREATPGLDDLLNDSDVDESTVTATTAADQSNSKPADEKINGVVQICILDSLYRNHERAISLLKDFIIGYAAEKYGFDVKTNEIVKHKCLVPQQNNFNDCGLHLVLNVETMLSDPSSFNKRVLKRSPKGLKQTIRMKKENEQLFNPKKMLNIREDLRDLLLQLLKDQVTEDGGDASTIGVLTAGAKKMKELTNLSGTNKSNNGISGNTDKTNGTTNGSSETANADGEDGGNEDEDDDDLMFIRAEDKEPIKPDLELSQVKPATEPLRPLAKDTIPKVRKPRGKPKKSEQTPAQVVVKLQYSRRVTRNMTNKSDITEVSVEKPETLVVPPKKQTKLAITKSSRVSHLNSDSEFEPADSAADSPVDSAVVKPKKRSSGRKKEVVVVVAKESTKSTNNDEVLSQDSYHAKETEDNSVKLLDSDEEDVGDVMETNSKRENIPSTPEPKKNNIEELINNIDREVSPVAFSPDKGNNEKVKNGDDLPISERVAQKNSTPNVILIDHDDQDKENHIKDEYDYVSPVLENLVSAQKYRASRNTSDSYIQRSEETPSSNSPQREQTKALRSSRFNDRSQGHRIDNPIAVDDGPENVKDGVTTSMNDNLLSSYTSPIKLADTSVDNSIKLTPRAPESFLKRKKLQQKTSLSTNSPDERRYQHDGKIYPHAPAQYQSREVHSGYRNSPAYNTDYKRSYNYPQYEKTSYFEPGVDKKELYGTNQGYTNYNGYHNGYDRFGTDFYQFSDDDRTSRNRRVSPRHNNFNSVPKGYSDYNASQRPKVLQKSNLAPAISIPDSPKSNTAQPELKNDPPKPTVSNTQKQKLLKTSKTAKDVKNTPRDIIVIGTDGISYPIVNSKNADKKFGEKLDFKSQRNNFKEKRPVETMVVKPELEKKEKPEKLVKEKAAAEKLAKEKAEKVAADKLANEQATKEKAGRLRSSDANKRVRDGELVTNKKGVRGEVRVEQLRHISKSLFASNKKTRNGTDLISETPNKRFLDHSDDNNGKTKRAKVKKGDDDQNKDEIKFLGKGKNFTRGNSGKFTYTGPNTDFDETFNFSNLFGSNQIGETDDGIEDTILITESDNYSPTY